MYLISNAIYNIMAQKLREEIDDLNYYSGVIDFSAIDDEGREVEVALTTTLFVCRSLYSAPDGDAEAISNIVPVWEECKLIIDGEEVIHDFDLNEIKNILCQWG